MTCADVLPLLELLPLAGDGDLLEPEERAALDLHLAACAACRDRAAALAGAYSTWSRDTEAHLTPLTPALRERTLDAHEAARHEKKAPPRAAPLDEAAVEAVRMKVVLTCAFCHDRLERAHAAFCATCLAPHHDECFRSHGKCSLPGCGETRTVVPQEAAAPPPRRGGGRRLLALLAATALGVGGAAALTRDGPPRPAADPAAARARALREAYDVQVAAAALDRTMRFFPVDRALDDTAVEAVRERLRAAWIQARVERDGDRVVVRLRDSDGDRVEVLLGRPGRLAAGLVSDAAGPERERLLEAARGGDPRWLAVATLPPGALGEEAELLVDTAAVGSALGVARAAVVADERGLPCLGLTLAPADAARLAALEVAHAGRPVVALAVDDHLLAAPAARSPIDGGERVVRPLEGWELETLMVILRAPLPGPFAWEPTEEDQKRPRPAQASGRGPLLPPPGEDEPPPPPPAEDEPPRPVDLPPGGAPAAIDSATAALLREVERAKGSIKAPPEAPGRIWLDATDLDLRALVRELALVAGVPVVVAMDIEERVSISLAAIPTEEALAIIARMCRCELVRREGVWRVERPALVTVQFTEGNLRTILQLVARYSGKDLLLAPDVRGTVTLDLKDVPWDVALAKVVEATGVQVATRNGLLVVSRAPLPAGALPPDRRWSAPKAAGAAGAQVDVDGRGQPLEELLDDLGRRARRNILLDPEGEAPPFVGALRGVPWTWALEAVAGATGCVVEERPGGVLIVGRGRPAVVKAAGCPLLPWLQAMAVAADQAIVVGDLGELPAIDVHALGSDPADVLWVVASLQGLTVKGEPGKPWVLTAAAPKPRARRPAPATTGPIPGVRAALELQALVTSAHGQPMAVIDGRVYRTHDPILDAEDLEQPGTRVASITADGVELRHGPDRTAVTLRLR